MQNIKRAEVFGMEKITSRNNDLIKTTKKLFTSRKARTENGKFVLEGARLCFDVLNSVYCVDSFFVTEKAMEKYPRECADMERISKRSFIISEDVAQKLGETENTQGVFAVCEILNSNTDINENKKYIALDSLQDPSNLGAIIRTAEALGIDGAICYNCCDLFNPKSLRASMGSILRMPVILSENLVDDIERAKQIGFEVYATVPSRAAKDIRTVNFSKSSICIIGNEGNGISEEVKNASTECVTINMLGRAESLNASMAGAITMWEMLRGN